MTARRSARGTSRSVLRGATWGVALPLLLSLLPAPAQAQAQGSGSGTTPRLPVTTGGVVAGAAAVPLSSVGPAPRPKRPRPANPPEAAAPLDDVLLGATPRPGGAGATSASLSVDARMRDLDREAARGMMTLEEYRAQRDRILRGR